MCVHEWGVQCFGVNHLIKGCSSDTAIRFVPAPDPHLPSDWVNIREDIEIHLNTCEIFWDCLIRLKRLSEMKKHINEEHEDRKALHHINMDRYN